jgi:PAS domain S-box-containing protein
MIKGSETQAIPEEGPPERVKVLLVDDRQDKLLALGSILGNLDLELIVARSGKEALRLVLNNEFAVILLDVSMPVMDGFETASLIRSRQSSEHTPIIFITAINASETHASHGYSLGAVDYIFAPVVPDILRAKVSVFIDLFRKSRDVNRRAEALRIQAERRADILESRLEELLNRLNVGVFRCTVEGKLVSANPAFFRLFGIHPSVPNASINIASLYLQSEDRSLLIAKLEKEHKLQEYHVRQRRVDGTIIWVSLSKTLITSHDGERYIDGLVEDITVRKEAEVTLMAKAEELARSNAELEQFAYVASHDLQEPLRMVSAYSSLVIDRYGDRLDDKGRSFLTQVIGGAKRMQELIKDILAFSRIGMMPVPVQVDCNQLLERVKFNLQDSIARSRATITYQDLPVVVGDPVLLSQLFQNLINNAIKFRKKDSDPVVTISAQRDGQYWRFAVSDNGIGIPKEHSSKIFGVFQRLHTREEYPGTGIGLAICNKVIQQHGGSIAVTSLVGVGSTFNFTIAVEPHMRAAELAEPGSIGQSPAANAT